MTCTKATTDTVTGYEWYKENAVIDGAVTNTYTLPDNKRGDSGGYACKITTANTGTSDRSVTRTVTFFCKYRIAYYKPVLLLEGADQILK